MKLFISIPSNRDWKGRFGASLAGLISHLMGSGVKGKKCTNFFVRAWGNASCLPEARQKFVDEMMAGNYTHWLSLDDDMTFPIDIVERLAAHDKDIVAVNARHKTSEIKGSLLDFNGNPIDSTDKTSIEPVLAMGGAIFLAKIDSFRHIPRPHFEVRWIPKDNAYLSEDRYFANLLHINGIEMWCDHDTSKLVTHIGDFEYGWPDASSAKTSVPQQEASSDKAPEVFKGGLTLINGKAA